MKPACRFVAVALICLFTSHVCLAQLEIQGRMGGIQQMFKLDEHYKIVDKTTGQPISLKAYQQLVKNDPYSYHLEPVFDEYAQPDSYLLRPTTAEERETHRFNGFDLSLRPKVGQPMPAFVMKGLDGKVYRLTDLKGRVVVLSFWISLKKPFWGTSQAKAFADVLRPYQSETDPVSLGVLHESNEEIAAVMATETLPFVPIPDAYGFNRKFQVTTGPSFIVVDRVGNVAAFVEGSQYETLRKALQSVSR